LGSVSQWDDKSGNARHVTQGTAAAQPTTGAATINGLNVLDFDLGDFLSRSSVDVMSMLDAGGTDLMFFSVGARNSGTNYVPWFLGGATFRTSFDFRGTWYFDVANPAGGRLSSNSTMTTGATVMWSGYRNGSQMRMRLNGTQVGTKSNASGAATTETATLLVGRFNPDIETDGTIAEVIVVPGYTAQGFADTETYLRGKWGI
jgi:hypothetical protein